MLIGLSGQSGAGKDTVADLLKTKRSFIKLSLADPLKRVCSDVFKFTHDQLWGPSESRNTPDERYPTKDGFLTPRVALQTLGTEWGRNLYEDVWIDYGIRNALKIINEEIWTYTPELGLSPKAIFAEKPEGVVIPDVRFKNEMVKIRQAGGYLVRVRRPGFEGNTGIQGHKSESEQKDIPDTDFDVIIENDSTTKELFMRVMDMYDYLSLRKKRQRG